jgi:hypothetical protein
MHADAGNMPRIPPSGEVRQPQPKPVLSGLCFESGAT